MPYLDSEPRLPFAPNSHTSYCAAKAAQRGRGEKTEKYLRCLQEYGPISDHQAADLLKLPLSSICSIRNSCREKLVKDGTGTSPYGRTVDLWRIA
jgi:hypothetical protein